MSAINILRQRLESKRGFTLIELLVVISIIAILITVIVATFGTTQEKARDNRRKTDLDAFKKGLEIYKSDQQGSAWYPDCNGNANTCVLSDREMFEPDITDTYIKDFPVDPRTGGGYTYDPENCDGTNDRCGSYSIIACLENEDDFDQDKDDDNPPNFTANSVCDDFHGTDSTAASYTINNP